VLGCDVLEEDTPELLADEVLLAVLEAVFDELDVVDPVVEVVELEVPVDVLLLVVDVKVAETVELVPDASETSKLGDCARMPVFCGSLEMRLIW
jgi:hypothetical protein